MPLSEKKKASNKKYDSRVYAPLSVKVRRDDREKIDSVVTASGLSLGAFVRGCCMYCIENNINVAEYIKRENIGGES